MNVETIFYCTLGAFVLIRFCIQPKLAKALKPGMNGSSPGPITIAKLASLKLVGTTAALLAMGAGVGMVLKVWVESIDVENLSRSQTNSALENVRYALEEVGRLRDLLVRVDSIVALIVIFLSVLAFLYWTRIRSRSVDERLNDELSRLREAAKRNDLEDLPPTARMWEVEKAINKAKEDNADSAKIERLYILLLDLDCIRRVDPALLHAASIHHPSSSCLMRLIEILISRSIFAGLGRLGSTVASVILAILIPASLGFVSADIYESVNTVLIALKDAERHISLKLIEEDVEHKFDKILIGEAESWCETGQISDEDCDIAANLGQIFENVWPVVRWVDPSDRREFEEARRDWSRRAVLIEAAEARGPGAVEIVEAAPRSEGLVKPDILDVLLPARVQNRPATKAGREAEKAVLRVAVDNPVAFDNIASSVRNYLDEHSVSVPPDRRDGRRSPARGNSTPRPKVFGISIEPPLASNEVKGHLVSEGVKAFGVEDEGILAELLGKPVQNIIATFGVEFVKEASAESNNYTKIAVKKTVVNLSKGSRVDETIERVKENLGPLSVAAYKRALSNAIANIKWINSERGFVKGKVTLQVPQENYPEQLKIMSSVNWIAELPPTEAFSSYASLFPGVEGQVAQSAQASVLRHINPIMAKLRFGAEPKKTDAPGGVGYPQKGSPSRLQTTQLRPSPTDKSKPSVARARSYRALRGFARVGGVLIGRDGSPSDTLDFRGFSYVIDPDQPNSLWIGVARADGSPIVLGPYNPAIAHLALTYAADGRPTTVTMVTASPLLDLKILLHPALVDTGLGCRAIRLDQFVDEFTQEKPIHVLREEATNQAKHLVELYKKAWATRFNATTDALLDMSYTDRLKKVLIDSYESVDKFTVGEWIRLRLLREAATNPAKHSANLLEEEFKALIDSYENIDADPALKMLRDSGTTALTPLRKREAYFDLTLLDVMENCVPESSRADNKKAFLNCVRRKATDQINIRHVAKDPHLSWTAPPPQIKEWSGVRERAFDLDLELDFAKPPKTASATPFRFIVQMTIVSPAYFAEGAGAWYDEKNKAIWENAASKQEPWEMTSIEEDVQDAVKKGVASNKEAASVQRDMGEFTVLQRLFRAAFDGHLGDQFPIEQLVRLTRETAPFVNRENIRTLRWKPNPGYLERDFVHYLTKTLKTVDAFREADKPCLTHLMSLKLSDSAGDANTIAKIKDECNISARVAKFSEKGSNFAIEKVKEVEDRLQDLIERLRLRDALGVVDEKAENGCPRP